MLKLTVHQKSAGKCSLTRKEGRVFLVSLGDEPKRRLLSAKGLEQLLEMYVEEPEAAPRSVPTAVAAVLPNGDHDADRP